jgi:hypothetical protein
MLFVDDTDKNCQDMHHNSQYLVVVYTHGRGTSIAELKPIFSNKGLRALNADFQKIGETSTESAKLLLYKKYDRWSCQF